MPPKKPEAQNKPEHHQGIKSPSKVFNRLFKLCDKIDGKSDALSLLSEGDKIPELSQKVYDSRNHFQKEILQTSLISLVLFQQKCSSRFI